MSNKKREQQPKLNSPVMEQTIPHQVHSPAYNKSKSDIREPFINEFGVVIGDSFYDSPNSPLNNWSTDVDPAIMAGDQWVHPTNDIGCNSSENAEMIEEGINPLGVPFMHPDKDVSYGRD
ncbi:DUF3905 domain-containing protein [Ammoniphilus sp. CFH 90114]|uniref:DUF3905 domain-containing protein n=1 Tax=Ammoniphilus sp. CFH 90114 TaxID=2493665 RepID=UPI00100E0E87|nr:DUF3905 domain-containing protein [Ammoniphilus sp. CFH 90114]RXT13549.1 DUF3905 domain-containing protein [Ammoniphilus sp. CFH 90114]